MFCSKNTKQTLNKQPGQAGLQKVRACDPQKTSSSSSKVWNTLIGMQGMRGNRLALKMIKLEAGDLSVKFRGRGRRYTGWGQRAGGGGGQKEERVRNVKLDD